MEHTTLDNEGGSRKVKFVKIALKEWYLKVRHKMFVLMGPFFDKKQRIWQR